MNVGIIILYLLLVTLVRAEDDKSDRAKSSRATKNLVCTGINGFGQQISARCYHPDYSCTCVNNPTEYPSCHCERNDTEQDTAGTGSESGSVTWKPLYVVSIGGGVVLIVVLTSVACCCMCRQWYSRRGPRRGGDHDKPPEYCDSPPPPYVHSSFYNTQPRPRTVQRGVGRIIAGPSVPRLTTTPLTPVEIPDSNARSSTAPNVSRGRRQRGGSAANSDGGAVLPGAVYRDNSFTDQSDVIMLPCYRNNMADDIHVVDVDS